MADTNRPHDSRPHPSIARLSGLFAMVLVAGACFVDRTGTHQGLDALPTFMCPDERATIRWFGGGELLTGETFTFTLTKTPGGVIGTWFEIPHSTTDEPMPPLDPAGVRATTYTGLFSRSREGDSGARIATSSDEVVVIGPEATYPHIETFQWSCDGAPGGGPGYSRVDYNAAFASPGIHMLSVRNLNGIPVRVAMNRLGEIATADLAPGQSSSEVPPPEGFLGPVTPIVLEAAPLEAEIYGPTGCMDGQPSEVVSVDEDIVAVVPRPPIRIELTLACIP